MSRTNEPIIIVLWFSLNFVITFCLVVVFSHGSGRRSNARHDVYMALEVAGHKVDEVDLHNVITEKMIVDNPCMTHNPEFPCQWNWSMAIQHPLVSNSAYMIDWDVAID